MKNGIKLAAAGVIGYFIGFYEMKYKIVKIMLQSELNKNGKDESEKENKEES